MISYNGGHMVALVVVLSVRTLCPSIIFTTLCLLSEEYPIFLFIVSFLATVVTGPLFPSLLFRAACGREISQVLALALTLSLAL
jgi:hypothetical protein